MPIEVSKLFKKPFRYILDGEMIMDADNEIALDVRGWGRLTGKGTGGLGLTIDEAVDLQDAFGELVAKTLNEHL